MYGFWRAGIRERWISNKEKDQLILKDQSEGEVKTFEKPETFDRDAEELKRSMIQLAVDGVEI